MLTLDHIVVTSSALAEGVAETEARLGQSLLPGGEHAAMGTHNRLLSLGPEEYFEVIAVDPEGRDPGQPRWYNLDARGPGTGLTHWAARCPDIDAALAQAPEGAGVPWDLARADLRWKMAVPESGQTPFDGLFPALIEWTGPVHPAPLLQDTGVRLRELRLHSPVADALRAALAPLLDDPRIVMQESETVRLEAVLDTPDGPVTL
ncbi:VOC family protein [Hasllibacter sp. MH4015]|uniref:VOC family protein n=1 Tax=Hasllibacter sp. MH4015 TaxID=2854029 RepID=UPI001CD57453|nr:VOC family protein [Hasllibacter sp. MH4015]